RLHAVSILGGERGDNAGAVDAQRREGLEVGLDAGATGAVRPGDGEGYRRPPSRRGRGVGHRPRSLRISVRRPSGVNHASTSPSTGTFSSIQVPKVLSQPV